MFSKPICVKEDSTGLTKVLKTTVCVVMLVAPLTTMYLLLIKKPTHTVQCDVTKSTLTGIAYYTYSGTLLSKIFEAVLTTLNSCHPFELQLSIGFHSTINLIIMSFLTMPTCFL